MFVVNLTKKTVNFCSAIALSALLIAGCNSAAATRAHLERAENYLKNQQFAEAALEFRSALETDKTSAAAHFGLARTYEEQNRFAEAVEELRQTAKLDRSNLEARVKLGNLLLAAQPPEIGETERLIEEIFAVNPNYAAGFILRAGLMTVQNRPTEEIAATLDRAIALEPDRVESYLAKARFFVARQNFDAAEQTFKQAIEKNLNAAQAHLDYANFLNLANRAGDAEREFRRAAEVAPGDRRALESLAAFLVAAGKIDRAEEAYRNLANLDAERPESKAVLADFYSLAGRDADAIKVYEQILIDKPEFVRGRARLGELFLTRNDLFAASEQANQILTRNSRDVAGLLLRARARLRGGDNTNAIKDLQEVLKQEPSSKLGLYFMSDAQSRAGNIEQARNFAGDLKRFHPNYLFADELLLNLDFAEAQIDKARRRADELLSKLQNARQPEVSPRDKRELTVAALTARGTANLRQNKIQEAANDFKQAQTIAPDSAAVRLNLARVAARQKNFGEAQNLYAKASEIEPQNFDALSGLINAKIAVRQFGEAHQILDRKFAEMIDSNQKAALQFLQAEIFKRENRFDAAENALQTAIDSNAGYLPAYAAYAALLAERGQTERAIEKYRRALERNPTDANFYTLIGLLEDARENSGAATENYRKALELNPNQAIAANNLAWLYAAENKGNLDEAAALVTNLVEKYPTEAAYADTLGWIFYKKGVPELGLAQARRAVALDEQQAAEIGRRANPAYRVRLAAVLAATGDKQNARRTVEVALQNSGDLTRSELAEANGLLARLN